MKQNQLIASAATLILATASFSSFAGDSHQGALGEPASPSAAGRTLSVTPDTTWLEVKAGEVVKFVVGGKTFSWNFDGDNTMSEIDLNKIAPQGSLNREVKVYINRMPAYDGA